MSEENTGYSGVRISKKQAKLWKATTEIARMKAEIYKKPVVHVKKKGGLHDAKEILSGVIMPGRERVR